MDNRRAHPRIPMEVALCIDHPQHGRLLLTTRDISESGVFVKLDGACCPMRPGERVSGQVQGLAGEAPQVSMRVVRCESTGVALTYLSD